MNGAYDGKQFVGIDLHRRRSVVVRMAESGVPLSWMRIISRAVATARPGHRAAAAAGGAGDRGATGRVGCGPRVPGVVAVRA